VAIRKLKAEGSWSAVIIHRFVPALAHRLPVKTRLRSTNVRMAWTYLIIAGLLEIAWAIGLKFTEGFSRLWPSVATIGAMIASFALLSAALKTIPVGTGYAVWTGIGAAGTALIGMAFLGESRELLRILCIVLIVAGVVGLKFASTPAP
jgi:quaternary ammonium compound-resistance protein SugE